MNLGSIIFIALIVLVYVIEVLIVSALVSHSFGILPGCIMFFFLLIMAIVAFESYENK